jgi:hypothetical protein
MLKYMSMMFYYFLKIIFDISTSKQFKKYKPHLILTKKIQNLIKHNYRHNTKQTRKVVGHFPGKQITPTMR